MYFQAFSQAEYPKIEKDPKGQTVVVMTLEQAQELDNATDLLALLEVANTKIADLDTLFIRVVADRDSVIHEQGLQIELLKNQVMIKESEIQSLLAELRAKDETIKNLDKQIANLLEQNAEKDKVIKALKVKSFLKSSIGGVIILALTAVVLL
jgi:uncharacterized protein (DUF3084 family)